MRKFLVASLLICSNFAFAAAPSASPANGAFLSYFSTQDMSNLVQQVKDNKLAGVGLNEIQTDKNFDSPTSLMAAAKNKFIALGMKKPVFFTNYITWRTYKTNYFIDNSYDEYGNTVRNLELVKSLAGINFISYVSLRPQTTTSGYLTSNEIGTLHFDAEKFDLAPIGKDKTQDTFCEKYPHTCWFGDKNGEMGNFTAFAKLNRTDDQLYGHLYKLMETTADEFGTEIIDTPQYTDNFINSTIAVVNAFNLDGVEMDLQGSEQNSYAETEKLANIVATLRQKLPTKIIVTSLNSYAAYEYNDKNGFTPHALAVIASNSTLVNFRYIDEVYFVQHGSKTAFAENIEKTPENTHSIHELIANLKQMNIDLSKVIISVSGTSYGIGGIDAGPNKDGLFQSTASGYSIPGAFDDQNCAQTNQCGSEFPYNYVIDFALASGQFTSHHYAQYGATSAYAPTWTPPTKK